MVVCFHSTLLLFSWDIHRPYRSSSDHILRLPILRLLISGLPQVCIFFVVSGYSISLSSLSQIVSNSRSGRRRYDALQGTLASSIARRHPRLFVPAISVALLAALSSHWGLYADKDWSPIPAFPSRPVPRHDSIWRQLLDWARQSLKHADPLQNSIHDIKGFPYDVDQWTIPLEFSGSMVVYLLLSALSRCRPRLRLSIVLGVMLWQLFVSASWVVFLFVGGMFIAEINLHSSPPSSPSLPSAPDHDHSLPATEHPFLLLPTHTPHQNQPTPRPKTPHHTRTRIHQTLKTLSTTLLLIFSLYLLSAPLISQGPKDGLSAPGYQTLQTFIPTPYWTAQKPDYFLIPIGAFLLVFSLSRSSLLRRPFTTKFALYLGRVSYSLYLVHGMVLYTFGAWVVRGIAGFSLFSTVQGGGGNRDRDEGMVVIGGVEGGVETGTGTGTGWVQAVIFYAAFWPVVIWLADLVCRGVDEPVVEGLRVLGKKVFFVGDG